MCIAIPSPVVELFDAGLPMAKVARGDETVDVCVAYLPEVHVGDYVITSNGFAIDVMDEEAAAASIAAFESVGVQLPASHPRPGAAGGVSTVGAASSEVTTGTAGLTGSVGA